VPSTPPDRASRDLAIFSHVDEPHEVWLRLFRADTRTRAEASVYEKTFSIEPEGEVQREEIVPARQDEIRFTILTSSDGTTTQQDHVHYYPVRGKDDPSVAFDLDPGGVMRMR
jgi:hypothetical protein